MIAWVGVVVGFYIVRFKHCYAYSKESKRNPRSYKTNPFTKSRLN